ncbi:MAG: hypothetical protein ACYCVN_15150 [Acidimicrobiales bacterium]
MQDILDHADELSKRFEDYEPSSDDEVGVAEYLLRRATLARARSERQIAEAVEAARRAGIPWKRIGAELGISAQAAQQRYGAIARPALGDGRASGRPAQPSATATREDELLPSRPPRTRRSR